jgi:hypothetical protein
MIDNRVYPPCEHVVATEFESGEGVLIDLNEKKYYQLSETAMLVWRSLEQGKTITEAVEEMTAVYDVTQECAAASVEALLRDLRLYCLVRQYLPESKTGEKA